jgi:putative ABC transport system ATP-binding protein
MSEPLLYDLRAVSKTFADGARRVHAVRELDLALEEGELLVVVGPSGSGKTTLLQLLGGLDRSSSGEVRFEDRDLGRLRDSELGRLRLRAFGFVFQQFNLIPTLTAAQNVEAALAPHARARDRRRTAAALLESVGLAHRTGHLPAQLSGGEQQRVAIARALANEPRVILADEPTGNLDSATGEEIVALLASLSGERGRTVVVVTHDAALAERATRVVTMRDGRLTGEPAPAAGARA